MFDDFHRREMKKYGREWELEYEDLINETEDQRLANLLKDFEVAIIDNGFIPEIKPGETSKHIMIKNKRRKYKGVLISIRKDDNLDLLEALIKQYIDDKKKLNDIL